MKNDSKQPEKKGKKPKTDADRTSPADDLAMLKKMFKDYQTEKNIPKKPDADGTTPADDLAKLRKKGGEMENIRKERVTNKTESPKLDEHEKELMCKNSIEWIVAYNYIDILDYSKLFNSIPKEFKSDHCSNRFLGFRFFKN